MNEIIRSRALQKLKEQENKCPICKKILENGYVDHNHATGQIRALLCNECNKWLGFIEKYPKLVIPMIKYLKKWEKLSIKQTA